MTVGGQMYQAVGIVVMVVGILLCSLSAAFREPMIPAIGIPSGVMLAYFGAEMALAVPA